MNSQFLSVLISAHKSLKSVEDSEQKPFTMPQKCLAPGCSSGCGTANGPPKHMFSCSCDSPMRASWEAALGGGIFPKTIWCCEDHFRPSDIVLIYTPGTPFQTRMLSELRKGAVPSIFHGLPSQSKVPKLHKAARHDFARTVQPSTSHSRQKQKNDSSGSRIRRRPREQKICDAIYCDDCGEFSEEACWDHVSHIENTPVVPLALASLPQCLMVDICENSDEKGIFTRNAINPQTLFGPMIGALCSSTAYSPFGCRAKDGSGIKRFHLDSDICCNWMRYVRFAKNKQEQNLMACMHDDEVYFVVTKEIQSGEELKVGYSQSYAEMLKECPEPLQHCPEPVEPVGLRAEWEAETYPGEIVEPMEEGSDYIEHHTEEGCSSFVRRSRRKRNQTHFYGAEEDEAEDDSESKAQIREEVYRRFVNPGPYLPTDQDYNPSPVVDFSVEALSALISPDQLLPDQSEVNSATTGNRKKKLEKQHYKRRRPKTVMKFSCTECSVYFRTEKTLAIHNLWHQGKEINVHSCPECKFFTKWTTLDRLTRHINSHGIKYEKCPICATLVACKTLKQHKLECQPGNDSEKDPDFFPPDTGASTAHSEVETNLPIIPDEIEYPSEFPDFGLSLDGPVELVECVLVDEEDMDCSSSDSGSVVENEIVDAAATSTTEEKLFPCDVCGKTLQSKRALALHGIFHKVPQCLLCAKMEESWQLLGQHAQEHKKEDGFHCPNCTLVFTSYTHLTKHYRRNHDITSFRTYEICQKSFRCKDYYERHMRCHSDQFAYSCEICGKGYHRKDALRKHMNLHHKKE